jgi:hypothetical protein
MLLLGIEQVTKYGHMYKSGSQERKSADAKIRKSMDDPAMEWRISGDNLEGGFNNFA